MPSQWRDYLSPPDAQLKFAEALRLGEKAFATQRDAIGRLIRTCRPHSVAFLGAGVMSDVPLNRSVSSGAAVYLVDRLPGIIEYGLAEQVVRSGGRGHRACIFCGLGATRATDYCRAYHPAGGPAGEVCDHFVPVPDRPRQCGAYARAVEPHVLNGDVTGGYATAFAEAVGKICAGTASWGQALSRAVAAARKAGRRRRPLAIGDHSIDLVVSSMVISQFEHEPYDFFARQAAKRLGPPSADEDRRLQRRLGALRSTLLNTSLERHCDEIDRIMAADGRCFMSFELFHHDPEVGGWFLVEEMHRALAVLGRRFRFDFDVLGDNCHGFKNELGNHKSVVTCMVLEHAA